MIFGKSLASSIVDRSAVEFQSVHRCFHSLQPSSRNKRPAQVESMQHGRFLMCWTPASEIGESRRKSSCRNGCPVSPLRNSSLVYVPERSRLRRNGNPEIFHLSPGEREHFRMFSTTKFGVDFNDRNTSSENRHWSASSISPTEIIFPSVIAPESQSGQRGFRSGGCPAIRRPSLAAPSQPRGGYRTR